MATKAVTCGFLRYNSISKFYPSITTVRFLSEINEAPSKGDIRGNNIAVKAGDEDSFFPMKKLVNNYLEKTSAIYDYGSIYLKFPNAKKAFPGEKPERRIVWEEQDCSGSFPASPEGANLDVVNYLEQRDMWQRQQTMPIPNFCVGSIVAVTRADRFSPEGWTRFVGLCVHKNFTANTKGSNFILRNVIQGEALEIQYPYYSPLIQNIQVLRHQRWQNEKPFTGLRFIRDFPLEYSTVDMNMQAEPYTETPSVREWTQDDKDNLVKWFDAIFESRKRR